ncbi:TPA: hypothetical protein M5879_004411 [Citrobacter koseri]|uniref:hypothetical protein n=1 Tax=Citrobacter koseri TaxID=545 RepID=UPI00388F3AC9|nr:hypothetical protein [Citrobacter koseri]
MIRPAGSKTTCSALLVRARDAFTLRGYDGSSLRAITGELSIMQLIGLEIGLYIATLPVLTSRNINCIAGEAERIFDNILVRTK